MQLAQQMMKVAAFPYSMFALVVLLAHIPRVHPLRRLSLHMSTFSSTPIPNPTAVESYQKCLELNPEGLRVFHPAFPLELLRPISEEEAKSIFRVKELTGTIGMDLGAIQESKDFEHIPWKVLPDIGISEGGLFPSKSQILDLYDKTKHLGEFVWAHKAEAPHKGCLLLNHWQQKVMFVSDYDIEKGAKGYELNLIDQHNATELVQWPPLALEIEITSGNWQPVTASDSLVYGLLDVIPKQMSKAMWEIVFLLLVSQEKNPEIMETLFDTGLSPNKGMIAYMRLLQKVLERTEMNENIPEYRQIVEKQIII